MKFSHNSNNDTQISHSWFSSEWSAENEVAGLQRLEASVGFISRVRGVRTNRCTIVICTSQHQLQWTIVTCWMSSAPIEREDECSGGGIKSCGSCWSGKKTSTSFFFFSTQTQTNAHTNHGRHEMQFRDWRLWGCFSFLGWYKNESHSVTSAGIRFATGAGLPISKQRNTSPFGSRLGVTALQRKWRLHLEEF